MTNAIQDNGDPIWEEEIIFLMKRGTWADLLDGRKLGKTSVVQSEPCIIQVERAKHGD
jgi:hypothetical protein